jgi:hypothetical protein
MIRAMTEPRQSCDRATNHKLSEWCYNIDGARTGVLRKTAEKENRYTIAEDVVR